MIAQERGGTGMPEWSMCFGGQAASALAFALIPEESAVLFS